MDADDESDDAYLAAVNIIFPNEMLFAAEGKRSVGVDTSDLCECSSDLDNKQRSIGVVTFGLACCQHSLRAKSVRIRGKSDKNGRVVVIENGSDGGEKSGEKSSDDSSSIIDFPVLRPNRPHPDQQSNGESQAVQNRKFGQNFVLIAPRKENRAARANVGNQISNGESMEGEARRNEGRKLRPRPVQRPRYRDEDWIEPRSPDYSDSDDSDGPCGNIRSRSNGKSNKRNGLLNVKEETEADGKKTVVVLSADETKRDDSGHSNPPTSSKRKATTHGDSILKKAKKESKLTREPTRICSVCNKGCYTKIGLRTHTELYHLGIRYRCNVCHYVTGLMPNMGRHFNKFHPDKSVQMKDLIVKFTE